MSKPYKLSSVLYGHSLDVRSVFVTPENSILSGSRDKTAKYWRPNELNTGYVEAMTYKDQKNFVAAVLYLLPSEEYPHGLIVTGGNDNQILIYKPNEPFATYEINEHKDAVCCLSQANDKTQFLSSSWDKTAKLWSIQELKQSMVTFSGHIAALWSVIQIGNGNVVTACADRTIGLWTSDGQQIKSLTGHSDCVRAVCDLPDLQRFVSVANDALVKVWNYEGDCMDTLHGHTNYIYCISPNPAVGSNCFVSGDENYSVKCWKDGVDYDTIRLPAQSVWTVACLKNGDIVAGTSDGVIRIFSQDESRHASGDVLKQYQAEINATQKQACQEIGGYKVSDLPGREALYDPGKSAGQIKMIRENDGVMAYSWVEEGDGGRWEKLGDVLGANEKANERKTLHEGRYYDFVFSVDVEDGKPPLKLPYNIGEDVYEAAKKFIANNYLPAVYFDQVVEFIEKNAQGSQPVVAGNDYVDPFTGGARYTPASTSGGFGAAAGTNFDPLTGGTSYTTSSASVKPATSMRNTANGNADPFTGSSSYSTMTTSTGGKNTYFPHYTYLKFENGDPKVILGKLKEFNEKIGDGNHKVDEMQLNSLIELCIAPSNNPEIIDGLFKLLEWPQDMLFPVLDVLRLAFRHEINGRSIVHKDGKKLIDLFKSCINNQHTVPNNTLLTFRTLCNMFSNPAAAELIYCNQFDLLENITTITSANKNIQIGMMTFLLNLSIYCIIKGDEMGIILLGTVLPDAINNCNDPEAHFRGLVALGNLLTLKTPSHVAEVKAKVSEITTFFTKLEYFTNACNNDLERKRQNCAQEVRQYFQ